MLVPDPTLPGPFKGSVCPFPSLCMLCCNSSHLSQPPSRTLGHWRLLDAMEGLCAWESMPSTLPTSRSQRLTVVAIKCPAPLPPDKHHPSLSVVYTPKLPKGSAEAGTPEMAHSWLLPLCVLLPSNPIWFLLNETHNPQISPQSLLLEN